MSTFESDYSETQSTIKVISEPKSMGRKSLLTVSAALLIANGHVPASSAQQSISPASEPISVSLWPGLAPGETSISTGRFYQASSGQFGPILKVDDITSPQIVIYPVKNPAGPQPTVIVFPGGGYFALASDLEGSEVAKWLNTLGYNAAVLHYRIPDWRVGSPARREPAFQDAQRAVSLIRANAGAWGLDPHRVGIIGFSAGGHLAARLAVSRGVRTYSCVDDSDKLSDMPDFVLLIYPAYLAVNGSSSIAPDVQPHHGMPPVFIAQTRDDAFFDADSYAKSLDQAGVSEECVIYDKGGHGYGLRLSPDLPAHNWPDRAATWLAQQSRSASPLEP